ncbi:hypothetical protein [Methanobrevibacter sp.]
MKCRKILCKIRMININRQLRTTHQKSGGTYQKHPKTTFISTVHF